MISRKFLSPPCPVSTASICPQCARRSGTPIAAPVPSTAAHPAQPRPRRGTWCCAPCCRAPCSAPASSRRTAAGWAAEEDEVPAAWRAPAFAASCEARPAGGTWAPGPGLLEPLRGPACFASASLSTTALHAGRQGGTKGQAISAPVRSLQIAESHGRPHLTRPYHAALEDLSFVENCMGYPCSGIITTPVTKVTTAEPVSRRRLKSACCSHPSVQHDMCTRPPEGKAGDRWLLS